MKRLGHTVTPNPFRVRKQPRTSFGIQARLQRVTIEAGIRNRLRRYTERKASTLLTG